MSTYFRRRVMDVPRVFFSVSCFSRGRAECKRADRLRKGAYARALGSVTDATWHEARKRIAMTRHHATRATRTSLGSYDSDHVNLGNLRKFLAPQWNPDDVNREEIRRDDSGAWLNSFLVFGEPVGASCVFGSRNRVKTLQRHSHNYRYGYVNRGCCYTRSRI